MLLPILQIPPVSIRLWAFFFNVDLSTAQIVPVPDVRAGAVVPAVPVASTAPAVSSALLDNLDALLGYVSYLTWFVCTYRRSFDH